MAEVSKKAVDSLVTKIEKLDLSAEEMSVLDAVLAAAEQGAEVEGFAFKQERPKFALPDLRFRIISVIDRDRGDDRNVVINHEEQY